jgi:hypothetical protein
MDHFLNNCRKKATVSIPGIFFSAVKGFFYPFFRNGRVFVILVLKLIKMKPKNYVVFLILLLTMTVTNTYAAVDNNNVPAKERIVIMTDAEKSVRLEEIKSRVNEIKDMDKTDLTKMERKDLKRELRDMKKEARVISGGVYLSVGAIIIIILLLILLL